MRGEAHQAGESPSRDVHRREDPRSDETLQNQTDLHEPDEVHEEVKHPRVNEHRRHETPPLAVRRPRPEVAAPADERFRVAEDAAAAEHDDKDRHVQGDEDRRHERPASASADGLAECLALRTPMGCGVLQFPEGRYHGSTESRPFLRTQDVEGIAAEDDENH